jgi:hypothetical protein
MQESTTFGIMLTGLLWVISLPVAVVFLSAGYSYGAVLLLPATLDTLVTAYFIVLHRDPSTGARAE